MATKQEEIREGVKRLVEWAVETSKPDRAIKDIIQYLHSQGVVLKVERKLPKNDWTNEDMKRAWDIAQKFMLKAGYVAVEPLFEEEKQ